MKPASSRQRIAVVLIHGIGEQRPMDTIRNFVNAVFEGSGGEYIWTKNFSQAELYDLRRISISGSRSRPVVDFYEFYWAHMMRDNSYAHLISWLFTILWRSPQLIPRPLRPFWWTAWSLILASVLGVGALTLAGTGLPVLDIMPPAASLTLPAILFLVNAVVLHVFADVARYFDTTPPNVRVRFEIQKAGVRLLKNLHASDRNYAKIIIVGHSLGSVIAYDIVNLVWKEMHNVFTPVDRPSTAAIGIVDEAVRRNIPVSDYRSAQRRAFNEYRNNGNRWRITDLITLGSPLTYADLLLATSKGDLRRRQAAREVATCPPKSARDGDSICYPVRIRLPDGQRRSVSAFDHASVFAVTRWTNLYFPSKLGFYGDVIAGPVAPLFGAWVRDIPLGNGETKTAILAHTKYWHPISASELMEKIHLEQLSRALNLEERLK